MTRIQVPVLLLIITFVWLILATWYSWAIILFWIFMILSILQMVITSEWKEK